MSPRHKFDIRSKRDRSAWLRNRLNWLAHNHSVVSKRRNVAMESCHKSDMDKKDISTKQKKWWDRKMILVAHWDKKDKLFQDRGRSYADELKHRTPSFGG